VNDQIGTPTNAADLANFIISLVVDNSTKYGITHFAGRKICSWADFAKDIIVENKLECTVKPIPSSEYITTAKRPNYSALRSNSI
jgi:dTDP-4-dehydrorhamnose reductase